MGYGNDGTLGSPARSHTVICGFEVAVLLPCCSPCALNHIGHQMGIAVPRGAIEFFASTLIVTGTDTRPRCEMTVVRKLRHVGTDLGENDCRTVFANAWNRLE